MFLLSFGKKKLSDKTMKELNEWGAKVYAEAYDRYYKMAKDINENVAQIFNDWWHGQCVSTPEYESQYSKEDCRAAGDIILTAISAGFG